MNSKHLASTILSIFSLAILTTAGCSAEYDDADEEYMEFELEGDDEEMDSAESAVTSGSSIIIEGAHKKIKSSYKYDKSTGYGASKQTLEGCAKEELDQMISAAQWGHYPCKADKLKNLYGLASPASIPTVNWEKAVEAWQKSGGHLNTINNHTKVGCATRKGSQELCTNMWGSSFPYCRVYSCAYSL